MRFTVQYIPLSKIKPDFSVQLSKRLNKLRNWMRDCVHLLVVQKNKKEGSYILVSGHDRFDFLQKHTNKKFAPCIVDESKAATGVKSWIIRLRNRQLLSHFPRMNTDRLAPASFSVIRAFLKQEPRFEQLSRSQQIKVLLLGIHYKKTVVAHMKTMVDELLSRP